MKLKRTEEIEEYIKQKKTVQMEELCKVFNVSQNTIRRDIKEILQKGSIKKVYGGVTVTNSSPLMPFNKRNIINKEAKYHIALKASEFVNDRDIIYIDSGTTTVHMIEGLKDKEITVFTNNLNFIIKALPYPNINIISLAGTLDRTVNSFVGKESVDFLKNFNIHKAFMASTGISIKNGITNSSIKESGIKKTAIERSNEVFLLLDSNKFSTLGLVTYADFSDIDYLLTDSIPENYKEFLIKENVKVEFCK